MVIAANPAQRFYASFRLLFAATLLAFLALAAAPPAEAQTFAPATETFTLNNGMKVVVIPDRRAPVVTHMVWYNVGSADETAGKSGIAHFLEHLMFKGTPSRPDGEFSDIVARIGGQQNAFTSLDYTGYFQRVAKEHLGLVMELEADRMANLILREDQVVSEREVVLEERRSRIENNPGSKLGEELSAALYRAHPYGRPVIGWQDELDALDLQDAIDFYNTYYTPNNATLVVAGDVEVAEVRRLAEKYYGAVARRAEPGERKRVAEPPQRAERRVVLRDPRVSQPSMQRFYDVPSYSRAEPGEAEAMDLLAQILGGGSTSRLYRALVVDQQAAASASAWYESSGYDSSRFGVHATPRGEVTLADLEQRIDAVIAEVIAGGVTEEELQRAKTQMIAEAVYAQDSQATLARVFGSALATGQSVADVQDWPNRIAKVTAADVQAAAAKFLEAKRSVTGYLAQPLPDEAGAVAATPRQDDGKS